MPDDRIPGYDDPDWHRSNHKASDADSPAEVHSWRDPYEPVVPDVLYVQWDNDDAA